MTLNFIYDNKTVIESWLQDIINTYDMHYNRSYIIMEVGISPYKNKTGFIHKICNINVLIYIVKTDLSIQLQMFYLEGNGVQVKYIIFCARHLTYAIVHSHIFRHRKLIFLYSNETVVWEGKTSKLSWRTFHCLYRKLVCNLINQHDPLITLTESWHLLLGNRWWNFQLHFT